MENLKPDKPDNAPAVIGGLSLRGIDWRQPSVISLILANLVPVFGVLFLHWQVFPLMFLFWSENLVIGVFNILKMLANRAPTTSREGTPPKIFLIPFFCVHYGMFCIGHGVFIFAMFGGDNLAGSPLTPDPGDFWRIAQENKLVLALLCLVASHGISFVTNYIRKGEYRQVTLNNLMSQPYGRIVVTHVAIILGGFLMQALHSPTPGLLLLVLLKILLDLRGYASERKNSQKDKTAKS